MSYKMVIILRRDLKWGKGKMIAHALHAALGALSQVNKKIIEKWNKEGSKKVVLKVYSLKEMKKIEKELKKNKIKYFLVRDAGKTQLKKGTITAIGIGPIEEKKIDKITGKLKLF